MRTSRELTARRLALRVVRNRDREAAQVLGDLIQEMGEREFGSVATGRTRPIRFIANAERGEREFFVRGQERLYNVHYYAARPTEDRWDNIFVMWVTPRREVYKSMVRDGILPRTVRFRELFWQNLPLYDLGWTLYLERVPKRRKRPVRTLLGRIYREDLSMDTYESRLVDIPALLDRR